MHRITISLVLAITSSFLATSAVARDTFHDISVKTATESYQGRNPLLDVPFYMAGQKHPRIADDLGVIKSNKRTNAFNKSDEHACSISFQSSLIALQKRPRDMGGDAVVDIKSITRHNNLESATAFRCVAGNIVANVALTGRIVRFAK
jgi:hypothetical protein